MTNGNIGVIIPAGGSGSRMGGVYKPLEKLCSKEMLAYSLEVFEKCHEVAAVVISAREDKTESIRLLCQKHGFKKVKEVVTGGIDRQSSVKNAFNSKVFEDEKIKYVAIHDAARPLLTAKDAQKVFEAAREKGCAVCAARVRDTLMKTDENAIVKSVVDREEMWQIQTPQVFEKSLYKASLEKAEKEGFAATDDSSLLLNAGYEVYLCRTPSHNFKITYEEDVLLAQALINYERQTEK